MSKEISRREYLEYRREHLQQNRRLLGDCIAMDKIPCATPRERAFGITMQYVDSVFAQEQRSIEAELAEITEFNDIGKDI